MFCVIDNCNPLKIIGAVSLVAGKIVQTRKNRKVIDIDNISGMRPIPKAYWSKIISMIKHIQYYTNYKLFPAWVTTNIGDMSLVCTAC